MEDALSTLLSEANPAQREAITHTDGPLLIVAGAGTGKTSVLVKRIAHLVLSGKAKTDEILAVTFTDKAAEEMEQRIDKLMPYGYVDLWAMTFHAFGERILRENGLAIGLPDSFKVLSQTDQWLLVRNNLERFNLDYYRPLGNPTKFIHALLRHFSRAKDELVGPEEYLKHAEAAKLDKDKAGDAEESSRLNEVAQAYHVYTQLLRENDALDFGDLINETVRLFKTRPKILEKCRKQFKYVIVDEFQDTNIAQFELLRMLAPAPEGNLTVVGDDDQSVYKFRGASISNILQFKEYYPKTKQVILTENYRSPQNVLDKAYEFIQKNNPNRLEAQLEGGLSKKLNANVTATGTVEHIHEQTVHDEARAVARKIKALLDVDKDTDLSQFAILVRANDTAIPFVVALQVAGIPYLFLASRGLYQKPVMLDIINYLKLLDNYHESASLYRMFAGPVVDLSHDDTVKLTHTAHKKAWSLFEAAKQAAALGVSEDGLKKVAKFLGYMEKHTQLARTGDVRQVIFAFLEDTGYLKRLVGEDNQLSRDTLSYINQFWRIVEEFVSGDAEPTARTFLERVKLELEAGESGSLAVDPDIGPEAVRVMTVHSAKGLEFDYVFLVSLIDRKFPSTERGEPIELPAALVKEIVPEGNHHLEEERRLFYVGMTRAKKGLYFTSADDYGGARKRKLSRFLMELGYVNIESRIMNIESGTQDSKFNIQDSAVDVTLRHNDNARLQVPDKFSFTQLKAFETCPLQYKFAHVLRIPVMGRATFSFGKTIHGALQKFFALVSERQGTAQGTLFPPEADPATRGDTVKTDTPVGKLVTEDELMKLYDASWIDDWYDTPARKKQYRDNGKKLLAAYYAAVKDSRVNPAYLEKPFNLKIGDATLRGAIDRMDKLPDGSVRIIDYKTGAPKDEKHVDREQLLIYQLAAHEVLGEKPSLLTYYFLEDGSSVDFLGTDAELAELRASVGNTIAKIRASDFIATPNKITCDHCDFKDICEFRAL